MSDELIALRNELTTWYMSLDQRTQGFFEAAYTQAPEAVTQAIGGQAVGTDEVGQYATLATMLGADAGGDITTVVPYMWAEPPTVDSAAAMTPFKVRWTDRNYGTTSSGHVDELAVLDESNNVMHSTSRDVQGLEKGGEATLEVDVPALRAGKYVVRILHNARGVTVDAAAYASRQIGISSMSEATFDVAEGSAPSGQVALDLQLVRDATVEMRPASITARQSHKDVLAEAIDTYSRAFGRDSTPFAAEVAELYRVTTKARGAQQNDQAFFAGTPSAAAVVAAGDAVASGQATPRQLLDSLNALARELEVVAAAHPADEEASDEWEGDTSSPPSTAAAAPTAAAPVTAPVAKAAPATLSAEAFKAGSYSETDEETPKKYVNLAEETSPPEGDDSGESDTPSQ